MRLLVEGGSYLAAADSLRDANHVAALQAQSLADRLAAYPGMAGSDASGQDFAASYDGAAAQSVAAVADLADAFTGLGVLTAASFANHRSAEEAADLNRISAYTGDDLHEGDYVRVSPAPPPSALGAHPVALDPVRTWIVDQIQGWLWPSADVALLREAAQAWTWASGGLRDLTDSCDTAIDHLGTQDSPEIPLALDALAELRGLVAATADDLHALGAACSAYAVQVEAARARLFTLLDEILNMVVEGVVISAAIGAITGGAGAAISGTAVAARVSAQAPRFHLITDALRGSAAISASAARSARESVGVSRAALEKFARVRVRTERGAVRLPGGDGWRVSLRAQDGLGGHAFERHVGKTVDELAARVQQEGLRRASTFSTEQAADELVSRVLASRRGPVQEWLASSSGKLTLTEDLGVATGVSVESAGGSSTVTAVRVVLLRSDATPTGWRILTAFPY